MKKPIPLSFTKSFFIRAAMVVVALAILIPAAVRPAQAACGTTNIALNKTAVSSSNEAVGTTPNLAVDGNAGTRWSSVFSDPQWIYVDLGSTQTVCRVRLNWEAAYGTAYQIQVSNNASTWTTIHTVTGGNGGIDDFTGLAGSGRYVRVYGTARATLYGYSLWELEVYAETGTTNTPTPTNTATTPPTSCGTTNLALNKTATSSSNENAGFTPNLAVDGNGGTRWSSAASDPQWIQIDLGSVQSICRVRLTWEAAYATTYQIQVSSTGTSWSTIYSTTAGNGGVDDLIGLTGSGRYIRMNGTARATQYGYSLWEFEVYSGTSTATNTPTATATRTPTATFTATTTTQPSDCGTTNIALNKTATSSSTENAGFPPSSAVDGSTGTRWSSAASDPQWIQIDLGSVMSICRVRLNWETAYGSSYQLQVSSTGTSWSTIYSTTMGNGGIDDLTGLTGSGRYIRMNGTARATEWGYSLWEFEVYSGTSTATNTPTATATRTPSPTPTSGGSIVLSYNAPAFASSNQDNANCGGCTADKAVDMLNHTRWATEWADPQWIYLDLGATANITRIVLKWEAAFGRSYQIQTSSNASSWTTIYSTTTGDGGTDDFNVSGNGRYVRLYATERGTGWGYSLFEFTVYGTDGAPQPTPTPIPTATPHGPDWVLVWSDEFNGASLNTANWNIEVGGTGNGNGELQYYTNGQNLSFGGGYLTITARQENPANYQCWYGTCNYTSSRITTQGKREFTYGRMEARLKLPYGQGIWPAFWMLGNDIPTVGWPQSGEIDIMENIGRELNISYGTLHGPGYSGANGVGSPYTLPSGAFYQDFHVFMAEWDSNGVKFFVDGTHFFTASRAAIEERGQWVFDHPFFFLLNIAVGGAWPGSPDATTTFPQQMQIDYVRVYQ